MPIGEKLRLIKKERGLTNKAIHEKCDVALSTVSRVVDEGCDGATFDTCARLARGLGFSLDELAGLTPPNTFDADVLREKDATIASYTEMLKEKDSVIASHLDMMKEKDLTIRSFTELLKTKDERVQELREEKEQLRKEKHRLYCLLACFVTFILVVLAIDVLHGHFGYFQY